MNYYVLFKDDFGDKHITEFNDYKSALDFYHKPSNVIFTCALISSDDLWSYVFTDDHEQILYNYNYANKRTTNPSTSRTQFQQ